MVDVKKNCMTTGSRCLNLQSLQPLEMLQHDSRSDDIAED